MKKKVIIGFSFLLSAISMSAYANIENSRLYNCEYNNVTQILMKMKQGSEIISKNPFNENSTCSVLLINKIEKPSLSTEDFNNHFIYKEYKDIVENGKKEVTILIDKKNNKMYQFLRVNEDDLMYKNMKELWSKGNSKMAFYFDDFIKLHELAHLSKENIEDIEINSKETHADISSVLMLSIENKLTLKETIELLESVQRNRLNDRRVGYRNQEGKLIKDITHYDQKFFRFTISQLKSIKEQDKILNELEFFEGTKKEEIPKFVYNKFKK